jgi:hypothetical protein
MCGTSAIDILVSPSMGFRQAVGKDIFDTPSCLLRPVLQWKS